MAGKFEKNYTDKGYKMNYLTVPDASYYNRKVLQFLIELIGISPRIWRRIHVPSNYNFWELHVAVQDAMGWTDSHLHQFKIKGKSKRNEVNIGIPDFSGFSDSPEMYPGWEIAVFTNFNDLGVEGTYEYDFGDGWIHRIKLEGFMFREPKMKYPLCIGGERACPPEDCGGPPGYELLLTALSDPKHEDHKEMKRWVGKDWNPEKFDPSDVKFDDPYRRFVNAFYGQ